MVGEVTSNVIKVTANTRLWWSPQYTFTEDKDVVLQLTCMQWLVRWLVMLSKSLLTHVSDEVLNTPSLKTKMLYYNSLVYNGWWGD